MKNATTTSSGGRTRPSCSDPNGNGPRFAAKSGGSDFTANLVPSLIPSFLASGVPE